MISGRSLLLCDRIVMTSRPQVTVTPSDTYSTSPRWDVTSCGCSRDLSAIAPVISSAAPMVKTTLVRFKPNGLCGLDSLYGFSDADHQMKTSPGTCPRDQLVTYSYATDSAEAYLIRLMDQPLQEMYVLPLLLEEQVTERPTSSHEFPIALLLLRPRPRDSSTVSDSYPEPGETIPFGRPYRTHLNGPLSLGVWMRRLGAFVSSTRDVSPRLVTLRGEHHDVVRNFVIGVLLHYLLVPTDYIIEHHQEIHQRDPCIYLHILLDHLVRDVDPRLIQYHYPCQLRDPSSYSCCIGDGMRLEIKLRLTIGIQGLKQMSIEADAALEVWLRDGIVRTVEDTPVDLGDAVRDFYHHMSEVRVDRIVGIETAQRRLEADQLIASGDRARMAEMIYSLRLENLKVRAMLDIERDRVSSLRLHMSLSQEEFRQIRRDRDDARGRLRRLESYLGRRFGFRP
ncbi:hypothetical protein Tco_0565493 [Tanacetum coccineum]